MELQQIELQNLIAASIPRSYIQYVPLDDIEKEEKEQQEQDEYNDEDAL